MTFLILSHRYLSTAGWVFMLALMAWAIVAFYRGTTLQNKTFLGLVLLTEFWMFVQSLIGAYFFWGTPLRPGRLQHFLYGALLMGTLPIVLHYTRAADNKKAAKIWAWTFLFMFGLIFRATSTGVMGG